METAPAWRRFRFRGVCEMPDTDLLIRKAKADDIGQITAIYAQAVKEGTASFELTAPDESEMRARFNAVVAAGYPYFVAHDPAAPDTIAGYAYAGPYRTRPAYRWSVENSVYVRPDLQGRGVGKRLLLRLIDATRALGFRQMVAIIAGPGNPGSIGLHESLGFELAGNLRKVGFKHGRWHDTTIMQLTLVDDARELPDLQAYPGNLWTPPDR